MRSQLGCRLGCHHLKAWLGIEDCSFTLVSAGGLSSAPHGTWALSRAAHSKVLHTANDQRKRGGKIPSQKAMVFYNLSSGVTRSLLLPCATDHADHPGEWAWHRGTQRWWSLEVYLEADYHTGPSWFVTILMTALWFPCSHAVLPSLGLLLDGHVLFF
jgi:hypothetical protein